jgi:cellulose synthase operon protein B
LGDEKPVLGAKEAGWYVVLVHIIPINRVKDKIMNKQLIKLLVVSTLFIGILIGSTGAATAQGVLPTATPVLDPRQAGLVSDPNIVTWEMLGLNETQLDGPYDSTYLSFGLPADWKLTEGSTLNLSLGIFVNASVQNQSNPAITSSGLSTPVGAIGAGTLTVYLNSTTLIVLPLDQVGEVEKNIQIPLDAFKTTNNNGFVEVSIVLNSDPSCYNFYQTNVVVRTSSYFTLPHELVRPDTSLMNFPRPIYQDSFIPSSVLVVIPDQPSAADLQAALTVAAGLDKLSSGNLTIDMVTLGKLTPEQETVNHLIFVGNSASLPILRQLQLPLPVDGGQFKVPGGSADDGLVQLVDSPWNNANVILVVSGNTDSGTIKAAQAVSNGVFRSNKFPNLAIVQEVQTTPVLSPQPTDQTLDSLGYKGRLFESRGVGSISYYFNIPLGWTVSSDANFGLIFGHSALINYNNSGIVVLLNGKPIGSVRMSDATAGLSTNKVLITIPASAVIPGKNRLEVRVNLLPNDECASRDARGLWVNVWPESTLHLPLMLMPINPASNLGLASYPAPFSYYPLLDNTAFVLQHNDLESWKAALKIAAFLGSNANGPVVALKVYYGDNLPETERSKYNFLIIGRPSQMPVMGEINSNLPISFLEGSDILSGGNFQVTYRISPDSPMGYMEMLPSPWNPDNVILAVLGNTPQGLNWATLSLIDSSLRYRLAGNFAIINDKQIITTDTRSSPTIKPAPTQSAEIVVIPPNNMDTTSSTATQQTAWVFPAFIASVVLIVLLSVFVFIRSWSSNRVRSISKKGGQNPGG